MEISAITKISYTFFQSMRIMHTKGAVTHWMNPQLVANFGFATWTKTGRIGKPATFLIDLIEDI